MGYHTDRASPADLELHRVTVWSSPDNLAITHCLLYANASHINSSASIKESSWHIILSVFISWVSKKPKRTRSEEVRIKK